jgi:hypothetical protein
MRNMPQSRFGSETPFDRFTMTLIMVKARGFAHPMTDERRALPAPGLARGDSLTRPW